MESMALMEVGGASEVEVGEVKDRLDDALCATRGGPRRKKSRFQKCLRFWRFTVYTTVQYSIPLFFIIVPLVFISIPDM